MNIRTKISVAMILALGAMYAHSFSFQYLLSFSGSIPNSNWNWQPSAPQRQQLYESPTSTTSPIKPISYMLPPTLLYGQLQKQAWASLLPLLLLFVPYFAISFLELASGVDRQGQVLAHGPELEPTEWMVYQVGILEVGAKEAQRSLDWGVMWGKGRVSRPFVRATWKEMGGES